MSVLGKVNKAAWLSAVRIANAVAPGLSTRIAVRFYRGAGMRFDGFPTFIGKGVWFDSTDSYRLITLSEGCTLSSDVRVLTHDWSPMRVLWSLGRTDQTPVGRLEPVTVGRFAFVGMGAILMPGATVGRGAIVGAGAVVRGDVPDYSIVVGNPGQVVGDARDYVARKFPEQWAELPRQPQGL